jgi:hypothetical protein
LIHDKVWAPRTRHAGAANDPCAPDVCQPNTYCSPMSPCSPTGPCQPMLPCTPHDPGQRPSHSAGPQELCIPSEPPGTCIPDLCGPSCVPSGAACPPDPCNHKPRCPPTRLDLAARTGPAEATGGRHG